MSIKIFCLIALFSVFILIVSFLMGLGMLVLKLLQIIEEGDGLNEK